MKTHTNLVLYLFIKRVIFLIIPLLAAKAVSSQTYKFKNPVRIFGLNLRENSIYRFSDVKPGTDAYVRISDLSNGVTLTDLDRTNDGYADAFQPSVRVPGNRDGYVEFVVSFFYANTLIPQQQSRFAISAVDVDGTVSGNATVREYISFDMGGGYPAFDAVNGQLSVQQNGSRFTGKNVSGSDMAGADTSNKQFMFTVSHQDIYSITIRAGIDNRLSSSQARDASIYFAPFSYNSSSPLTTGPVLHFNGVENENGIQLEWEVVKPSVIHTIILERSVDGISFQHIRTFPVNHATAVPFHLRYLDVTPGAGGKWCYRLKMMTIHGRELYSDILRFTSGRNNDLVKMYPTIVTNRLTINFTSDKDARAVFELAGLSGNIVYRQQQRLFKGLNSFTVGSFSQLKPGNYWAILKTADQIYSRQVVIGVQ